MADRNTLRLDGMRVVITGGAGFLGVEHAVAVSAAGGVPVLLDINEDGLQNAADAVRSRSGGDVETVCVDICDREALAAARDKIAKNGGDVDAVINNAAINPAMTGDPREATGRLEDFPVDVWDREFRVGVTGALLVTQIFGPPMAERGSGVFVNIASDLGVIAPDHRIYTSSRDMEQANVFKPVSYSVTKHALIGLTKYVATYWGHRNVRCNALAPGGVFNDQDPDLVAGIEDRVPMGRMARRDEYHGAVVYLLSDASSYMTGQVMVVDGGRSAW